MEPINSLKLKKLSHELVPGGAHTYAKGDDQFPSVAPGFIERGSGCHVWDMDGNEYIEYGMGLRAVTLGHGYEPVAEAAAARLRLGTNFTRPCSVEIEAAQAVLGHVEGAEQIKFTKDGSTATSAAIKLARAHTGRDKVVLCADHAFFSYDDWFIGTTAMDLGVPQAIKDLTLTFRYNDLEGVRKLFEEHPESISCVILEPARLEEPKDGFLHRLRDLCHENGALFILDENVTGFRYDRGGGQKLYDIVPDLSAFGKALANGFAVSALAGRREFMDLGGILQHEGERCFLLSTTHGGETHALAACIATMEAYKREPVIEHMRRVGARLEKGFNEVSASHALLDHVAAVGPHCDLVFFTRDPEGRPSQAYRALFMQELISRGVLGPSLVVSFAHSEEDIDRTIEAVDGALTVYARALNDGAEKHLVGRPTKVVFRKFN